MTDDVRWFAVLLLASCACVGVTSVCGAADGPGPDSTKSMPYDQGAGIPIVKTEHGTVNFKLTTYLRYLNQNLLDEEFTDAFGVPKHIDVRQDIQLTKVNLSFLGWFLDPKLRYLGYVWTSNTSQGQLSQVVVGGNVSWRFSPRLTVAGGIGALPTTRSTEGTWPNWLPVDNRQIADDYFRGSYTSGIWASGDLPAARLEYQVMLGNNLSQLGIDANQLDNNLNTWSAKLAWMPTTGEFGKSNGFGDFDQHENVATRFGIHGTTSDESRQSQSSPEAIENSQIRISDGNIVFTPSLFGPGIDISDVDYQMVSGDAGVKFRGWSLESEFYWRRIDAIRGANVDQLAFDHLTDIGYQVFASAMAKPSMLQLYAGVSTVFGDYGDPWDVRGGVNLFPLVNKAVRCNAEYIYLSRSPVGNSGYPYPVGANGPVFHANFELNF